MKFVLSFFVASSIAVTVILGAPLEETTLSVNSSPGNDKLEVYVKEQTEGEGHFDQSTEAKSSNTKEAEEPLTNFSNSTSTEQGSESPLTREKREPQHHHHHSHGHFHGHGHGHGHFHGHGHTHGQRHHYGHRQGHYHHG